MNYPIPSHSIPFYSIWRHVYASHTPLFLLYPRSKVHGANMGPTWVLSAPDGPHVGPMNLAIRVVAGETKKTVSSRWVSKHGEWRCNTFYASGRVPQIHLDLSLKIHMSHWPQTLEIVSPFLWGICLNASKCFGANEWKIMGQMHKKLVRLSVPKQWKYSIIHHLLS